MRMFVTVFAVARARQFFAVTSPILNTAPLNVRRKRIASVRDEQHNKHCMRGILLQAPSLGRISDDKPAARAEIEILDLRFY